MPPDPQGAIQPSLLSGVALERVRTDWATTDSNIWLHVGCNYWVVIMFLDASCCYTGVVQRERGDWDPHSYHSRDGEGQTQSRNL